LRRRAKHEIGGKRVDYGYLWWPIPGANPIQQGAFEARGIFGQHLYLNPKEGLAIVVLSARPKPDAVRRALSDTDFFGAVAEALHSSQP
jgi:hypothetical protein